MDLKDIAQQNRQVHPWMFYKKCIVSANSVEHSGYIWSAASTWGQGAGGAWHWVRDNPHPPGIHGRVLSVTW